MTGSPPVDIDRSQWSGEGDFTQTLVDWFTGFSEIAFVRVEDASSTRSDVDYNFISNEIYLRFETRERVERRRVWGIVPVSRIVSEKVMTLEGLEARLAAEPSIGPPDYADDGMMQYLHNERVIPPYQTKGYKLIELVRIYELATAACADPG